MQSLSNAIIRGGTTLEPAEVSHYQSAVVTADWQRSAGLLEISDPSVSVGSLQAVVGSPSAQAAGAPYEWAGLI